LAQHPFLGLGVGGWSIYYYNEDVLYYPHNMLLEVAAEQGIIGLSIVLLIFVILFREGLKLLRSEPYVYGFVFPALVFSLCYHFTTGTVESRSLWFTCGLVAAASRMRIDRQLSDEPAEAAKLPVRFARRPRRVSPVHELGRSA
jgi:O-antigen ligase